MTPRGLLSPVLLAAAIGAAIAWQVKPTPAPGPSRVEVDTVYAERERPDLVKPSIGKKVTTVAVRPMQTRVASAPSAAGRKAGEIYCRPAIAVQTNAKADSGSEVVATSSPHSPALLPDFQGRIRGSRVTLYSTLNDGRRWSADYRPRGHWTFQTDGDSVIARSDRLWVRLVRGARDCAIAGAAGGLAGWVVDGTDGAKVGAATSCGATILF